MIILWMVHGDNEPLKERVYLSDFTVVGVYMCLTCAWHIAISSNVTSIEHCKSKTFHISSMVASQSTCSSLYHTCSISNVEP